MKMTFKKGLDAAKVYCKKRRMGVRGAAKTIDLNDGSEIYITSTSAMVSYRVCWIYHIWHRRRGVLGSELLGEVWFRVTECRGDRLMVGIDPRARRRFKS